MKKFTLIGASLMMLIPGFLYLVMPQMMLDAASIQLVSVNDHHLVRAAYGGGFLGIAALFGMGAVYPAYERASLMAIAFLLSGFAIGRLYSLVFDGAPAVLFVGVLFAEVLFAALAVLTLRKEPNAALTQ